MRKINELIHRISLLPSIVGLFSMACAQPDTGPTSPTIAKTDVVAASLAAIVRSVDLDNSTPLLARGQTLQLEATLKDAAGEVLHPRAIHWASADPSIVQVHADGLTGDVTALAPGTTTVTGTI